MLINYSKSVSIHTIYTYTMSCAHQCVYTYNAHTCIYIYVYHRYRHSTRDGLRHVHTNRRLQKMASRAGTTEYRYHIILLLPSDRTRPALTEVVVQGIGGSTRTTCTTTHINSFNWKCRTLTQAYYMYMYIQYMWHATTNIIIQIYIIYMYIYISIHYI